MTMSEPTTVSVWAPPALANPEELKASVDATRLASQQRVDDEIARGFAEGRQAGEKAAADKLAAVESMLTWLAKPFARDSEEIEAALTDLAVGIAKQVIRKEVQTDRAQIVAVIREALTLLPTASRSVEIAVHPDDAALLRELLATSGDEKVWELLDDPLLGRGEFRIRAENSTLDGTLDGRLNEVIAGLAQDMRRQSREPDESK